MKPCYIPTLIGVDGSAQADHPSILLGRLGQIEVHGTMLECLGGYHSSLGDVMNQSYSQYMQFWVDDLLV